MEMIEKPGVQFEGAFAGREGYLKCTAGDRSMSIFWELGFDPQPFMRVSRIKRKWENGENVAATVQCEILRALRLWLTKNGIRSDMVPPGGVEPNGTRCLWASCSESACGSLAICANHFDQGFLETEAGYGDPHRDC